MCEYACGEEARRLHERDMPRKSRRGQPFPRQKFCECPDGSYPVVDASGLQRQPLFICDDGKMPLVGVEVKWTEVGDRLDGEVFPEIFEEQFQHRADASLGARTESHAPPVDVEFPGDVREFFHRPGLLRECSRFRSVIEILR